MASTARHAEGVCSLHVVIYHMCLFLFPFHLPWLSLSLSLRKYISLLMSFYSIIIIIIIKSPIFAIFSIPFSNIFFFFFFFFERENSGRELLSRSYYYIPTCMLYICFARYIYHDFPHFFNAFQGRKILFC